MEHVRSRKLSTLGKRVGREALPMLVVGICAIELFSTRSADALTLGGTQSGGYSVLVLPGEYEARYNWYAGSTVPRNQLAAVGCARVR